jgi:hypothetical protein
MRPNLHVNNNSFLSNMLHLLQNDNLPDIWPQCRPSAAHIKPEAGSMGYLSNRSCIRLTKDHCSQDGCHQEKDAVIEE